MHRTRRDFLRDSLGGASLLVLPGALQAQPLPLTPRQTEGPFYPRSLPPDADNDLARVLGQAGTAGGELTHLVGRVLDSEGRPLAGARVEIWQCDHHGSYHHPDDDHTPRDAAFQGYGRTVVAADGGYRFRTIKPVPYPGRTPHIHMRIVTPAGERFSTQIYVRGHALNAKDFLFRNLSPAEAERLQVDYRPSPDGTAALLARFDAVLPAATGAPQ